MIRILLVFAVFAVGFAGSNPAQAVLPQEQLSDPVLEKRAREVSKNLRCVVCQNQSIDDSNAELAADMRRLVRERIVAGDSNQQATDYLVDRYGKFVLLRPPLIRSTLALWLGPFLFVLVGGIVFWRSSIQKKTKQTMASKAASDPDHQTIDPSPKPDSKYRK